MYIYPQVLVYVWDVCTQNGLEATKLLRKGGYKNLVVGVTGNVLDDDVSEYQAAGADIILG